MLIAIVLLLVCSAMASGMSVTLEASLPSPQPVGTMVSWYPVVSDAASASLWYRFRVRRIDSGDFRIIRDYGPGNVFTWTASDHEGSYEVEVSVRDRESGETATTSMSFDMTSRVVGETPVISESAHPLVWIYSAPPCPPGARMKVQFRGPAGVMHATSEKPCQAELSMNFYLAGLLPNSTYSVRHVIEDGYGIQAGPELTLNTGPAGEGINPASPSDELILHSPLNSTISATDLAGNVVWYYPDYVSILTRPVPGGSFVGIVSDEPDLTRQIVREFDLVGMTLQETNAAVVNEQLAALGKRPISAFHHEARRLPDGKLLVLASSEEILTDVQGPGPVDVIGDTILILDSDLRVVWVWDSFDHLDPRRTAIFDEKCVAGMSGCPAFFRAPQANDWLHSNSVQLTPDGHLVMSVRHQDWVIKIDYNNGQGSGNILWRLGKDGDFWADSPDPNPWFSHQHDAEFEFGDNSTLILFDNGNTRRASDPTAHSRGQVIQLDEQNRAARFILNADLGAYSAALGSAQKLANGNYEFGLGFLPDATTSIVQVDPSGKIVAAHRSPEREYRVFRMTDLYNLQ